MHPLELIYQENVKLSKTQSQRYEWTLKCFLDVFIQEMKQTPLFNEFFKEVYFGGSFFDGLKLASTSQEFDLNLLFEFKSCIGIEGLNTDSSKPNFAYLELQPGIFFGQTQSERKLSFENEGVIFLSPAKLFDLVQSAADRSISNLNGVMYISGKEYKVKKHYVGAPFTLFVECEEINFKCEIDLVPSVSLEINQLPREVQDRVRVINKNFNSRINKCMGIALKPADRERFEIDFHDIERDILRNREVAKKVVMLMKHLRDIKGGPLSKFWSHLLKTVVMNRVMESETRSMSTSWFGESNCWDKQNLEECLIVCLKAWFNGINHGIKDVFFPDLDLMDRISKYSQATSNTKEFLSTVICKIQDRSGVYKGYNWMKVFAGCPVDGCHRTNYLNSGHQHFATEGALVLEAQVLVAQCATVDYGTGLAQHIQRFHPEVLTYVLCF